MNKYKYIYMNIYKYKYIFKYIYLYIVNGKRFQLV